MKNEAPAGIRRRAARWAARLRTFAIAFAAAAGAGLALAAPAELAAPADWRKESFEFPLPYAPTLPYMGVEEVRFTPAWAHFAAEDGFSYVVLWDIKPAPLEVAALERALAVYFDGLMNNVAIARKLEAMVAPTAVVLHPLAAPAGWREGHAGAIHTWNGFTKGEPLVLNVEIAQRSCGGDRMQVFFALSKAPRAARAWEPLRRVRDSTGCGS